MAVATDLPVTILEKTREGKLSWERLSSGGYFARIGAGTLTVDKVMNVSILRIANEEGIVVETLSSGARGNTVIEDLYELVRRRALRVDETLSNIKRSLDSL
jgi:hypothetical protein